MKPDKLEKKPKLEVLQTPFCGDLRSKKFYLADALLSTEEEYYDGSGHTWCYHTQLPLGPDGKYAAPEFCKPGRGCYRSALQEPELYKYERPDESENPEI